MDDNIIVACGDESDESESDSQARKTYSIGPSRLTEHENMRRDPRVLKLGRAVSVNMAISVKWSEVEGRKVFAEQRYQGRDPRTICRAPSRMHSGWSL